MNLKSTGNGIGAMNKSIRSWGYWFLERFLSRGEGIGVILVYHSLGSRAPASLRVPRFRRQLDYLADHFRVLSLDRFVSRCREGDRRENLACLTFDDGYRDHYEVAAPLLEQHDWKGTFFVAPGYLQGTVSKPWGEVSTMTPRQVTSLHRAGHEIGAHGLDHHPLPGLDPEDADRRIRGSKRQLESLLGVEITSFAYPYGARNDEVRNLVRKAGFKRAVTTEEGLAGAVRDPYEIPRLSVSNQLSERAFTVKTSRRLPVVNRIREFLPF